MILQQSIEQPERVPLNSITFDKRYWSYIAFRWPDAYLDFVKYFRAKILDDEAEIWDITPQRQERLIINFAEHSGIYYENPYVFSRACGLIYEWFCKYTMQKGYMEDMRTTKCQGKFIPESLYLILPDRYKI